jgi:hypothetical protein
MNLPFLSSDLGNGHKLTIQHTSVNCIIALNLVKKYVYHTALTAKHLDNLRLLTALAVNVMYFGVPKDHTSDILIISNSTEIFPEELIVAHLVRKTPVFHGSREFSTVFTKARYRALL